MSKSIYRSFNYIGSKIKLINFLHKTIETYSGKKLEEIKSFADLFAGTGVVSFHFMKNGCKKIITNDIQHYSYTISSIWNLKNINIDKIKELVIELNKKNDKITEENIISTEKDFIYNNYTEFCQEPKKYFTTLNGFKIDKTRQAIEKYFIKEKINDSEYRLLIKILLYSTTKISNIASVYGSFLKKFKKTSLSSLFLDISMIEPFLNDKNVDHQYYNLPILDLLEKNSMKNIEIVYLDPPYNNRRYDHNYHLLETISKYDNPEIKGKTGTRKIDNKSALYSKKCEIEFSEIINSIKSKYLFISYNSESILSKEKMIELLEKKWFDVRCYEKTYTKFKTTKTGEILPILEYLFCASSESYLYISMDRLNINS